jgi:hypothetical protein
MITGGHHSLETRQKMRAAKMGRPVPWCGHHSEESKIKIRNANLGKIMSEETKLKISQSKSGRPMSELHKKKLRIARISNIKKQFGQTSPAYNPIGCRAIEEYGKANGFNFQHAENGGEFHIKELGYWVDGYDADRNIVIEFDEPKHNKTKERDLQRQLEIIEYLKCKFVRIQ